MTRKDFGARTVSDADDGTASILHVDMDAFFVAVELLERPELRGEQVIVGGVGGRGVVSSASYEARALGVRAAMPMSRALQLAPRATVIPGEHAKYRAASAQVFAILREFTPLVEPLSIDEAFLDVRSTTRLFGPPAQIARTIRREVHARTGLTCSIGVAATKFVAKLASGKCKPDGLLVVPAGETVPFLHALPIGAMWGVGAATAARLAGLGIHTVFDLAHTPAAVLERAVGKAAAAHLSDLAWGEDARAVTPTRREKSVSHEHTFEHDEPRQDVLARVLRGQADAVAARLRRAGLVAGTVALKLRWPDFSTITRQVRLEQPSATGLVLYRAAAELLEAVHPVSAGAGAGAEDARASRSATGRPVRLIGVRASDLVPAADATAATLWSDDNADDWAAAEQAADAAAARFGTGILRPASLLDGT